MLKQAGEISSKPNSNEKVSNNGINLQDIPVLNIPECPDRTPRRIPFKPQIQQKQGGLTAPTITDVSSSGPMDLNFSFFLFLYIFILYLFILYFSVILLEENIRNLFLFFSLEKIKAS